MTHPAGASALIEALLQPQCYPHTVKRVERLETHISWIFLTGPYAYKIKKPVKLGFLDFSSLEARRHYCEEELRLNRRLAHDLYLDIVEIRGLPHAPRIAGHGPVLEYAVRMREFPQEALANRLLARGELTPALVTGMASHIAAFHAQLPPALPESRYGTPESVLKNAQDNFEQISSLLESPEEQEALKVVREWTERELILRDCELRERRSAGMVRECHGDLHLGNIVLLDGELVPFDCIEFNPDFRWNDVMSEIAFVMMDLLDRGAPRLAWLFLSSYLEATGVYSGLSVLRFYLVYRAMVRAKVHLIRAQQCAADPVEQRRLMAAYRSYVELATQCAALGRPALVLMRGLSGSGKSTVAQELVQALGAVHVRSDVERKRLHGRKPMERTGSAIRSGLYGQNSTEATYARLAEAARVVAQAGYTAIVDATFLQRSQRAQLRAVADALGVSVAVIDVQAPQAVLRERIARRATENRDPSEATLEVLEHQTASAEPILLDEQLAVICLNGHEDLTASAIDNLVRRLLDISTPGRPATPSPCVDRPTPAATRSALLC